MQDVEHSVISMDLRGRADHDPSRRTQYVLRLGSVVIHGTFKQNSEERRRFMKPWNVKVICPHSSPGQQKWGKEHSNCMCHST